MPRPRPRGVVPRPLRRRCRPRWEKNPQVNDLVFDSTDGITEAVHVTDGAGGVITVAIEEFERDASRIRIARTDAAGNSVLGVQGVVGVSQDISTFTPFSNLRAVSDGNGGVFAVVLWRRPERTELKNAVFHFDGTACC